MKNFLTSTAMLLALAACGQGTDTNESASARSETQSVELGELTLSAFFDKSMQERLAYSPLLAERLGDRANNDKWPSITEETADELLALYKAQLKALKANYDFEGLSDTDKQSYRIFEIQAQRFIDNDRWRNHGYPVNQMFGRHTGAATHLMTVHQVGDTSDAEAYIKRLEGLEVYFAEVAANMKQRADKGIIPPKFVFPYVLKASENVISGAPFEEGEDGVVLADFRKKVASLNLSDAEANDLLSRATTALLGGFKTGYDTLIAEMKRQEAIATTDDGAWKFPDGEEYYAQALKNNTTTDMTANEIHQLGLDNVARIHAAMREIMKQVEFEGSLQDFFAFTRDDPQFYYPNTEEGKAEYLARATKYVDDMRAKVPDYFDLMPKAAMEVRAVEKFRENSSGKAFYQRSAPDGSRPGIFYANLRDMRLMPTYQLEALAYHEGIPGHHFQIAISQELEGVPMFQRTARFTAFTEGWGLYTEELGKDMGFYEDPYSDFGRLAMELWRACRLVVDTGLHHKKWTRQQAIDYLSENTPNPLGDNIAAIERYIVMPGQATAYLVGKIKIMELRQKAMDQLGDKFDWRGFHTVVLAGGAMPLSMLEENVNAWIAKVAS